MNGTPSVSRRPWWRSASTRGIRRAVGGGAIALAAVSLVGCATPGTGEASSAPRIVATTTQVGDFTRELVGESAEVTQLLTPGQSAHSFDPSASQLVALSQADALVVNGGGLESWVDDAIEASGFDGRLVDASTGIELFGTGDHDHDDEPVTETEHSDTDAPGRHDEHDHDGGNPHIWTDPELAAQMVENIADGLVAIDGIDAADVEANETAYVDRLEALDEWIESNVDRVPAAERLLVTNHDAFTYFIDAYDVTFVGSVIPSFDDNAEPSAAEIDDLVAKIRDTGARAVFSEASLSPKAAQTIAKEAGVTVYSGPDALYGDSLGAEGTEGESYLGSQLHNARLILESWGIRPTAAPASLEG